MKVVKYNGRFNTQKIINELNSDNSIAILPTDTVYGIFAKVTYDNWKTINKIKGREEKKDLTITFHNLEEAKKYIKVSPKIEELLLHNLPGKKTFIVQANLSKFPFFKDLKKTLVGIRIISPEMKKLLKISENVGPLISTSCNISGEPPLYIKDDISKKFDKFPEIKIFATSKLIDGSRVSSKIYDISDGKTIRIIR